MDLKAYVSKGLLTGTLNSLVSMLLFQGSDIIDLKIPFLGNITIPDAVVVAGSGFVGSVASDLAHDSVYKVVPLGEKLRSAETALSSLAAYNVSQLPILYLSKMPAGNIPMYLVSSSGAHALGEMLYHDVLDKKSG